MASLELAPDLDKSWESGSQAHFVAAKHQQAHFEKHFDISLITKRKLLNFKILLPGVGYEF